MQSENERDLRADTSQAADAAPMNQSASADQLSEPLYPEPDEAEYGAIDIVALRSALASLDPDCDERTWMFHRVAALANTAADHPELRDSLWELAWQFSSGKLAGRPAEKWTQHGKHGSPRVKRLKGVWNRFLHSTYDGERTKVESIFFHARRQGWSNESFEEEAQ